MRETPETDAAVENTTLHDRNHPRIAWVPADFARKLERERDEATAGRHAYKQLAVKHAQERDEAREQCRQWLEEWHLTDRVRRDIKAERDEAREKYATEATEHMLAVNKLCGERDEALEKLNPLRQSLRDSQDEVLRLTLENRIF